MQSLLEERLAVAAIPVLPELLAVIGGEDADRVLEPVRVTQPVDETAELVVEERDLAEVERANASPVVVAQVLAVDPGPLAVRLADEALPESIPVPRRVVWRVRVDRDLHSKKACPAYSFIALLEQRINEGRER